MKIYLLRTKFEISKTKKIKTYTQIDRFLFYVVFLPAAYFFCFSSLWTINSTVISVLQNMGENMRNNRFSVRRGKIIFIFFLVFIFCVCGFVIYEKIIRHLDVNGSICGAWFLGVDEGRPPLMLSKRPAAGSAARWCRLSIIGRGGAVRASSWFSLSRYLEILQTEGPEIRFHSDKYLSSFTGPQKGGTLRWVWGQTSPDKTQ